MVARLKHLLAVLAGGCMLTNALALPTFSDVRRDYVESDAWLLARDGRPLHVRRIDMTQRRLTWTRIEDISPAMLRALLVSEDRNFYDHAGVDWGAAAASAWRNLWNRQTRGASTLSMQLVGLLGDAPRRGRRNLTEKIGQAGSALWLERHWKKDEILEAYLNLAGFRGELVGIGAMSRGLFGKWPDGLDEREAALAAALLRAPGASTDALVSRACGVLKESARVARRGEPTCDGLDALARLALAGGLKEGSGVTTSSAPQLTPHLAAKLLAKPGERLITTLNADLQAYATTALHRQLRELARQNAEDGAVLVIDNASGDILAWVGSSGALSDAPAVDGVTALRQAGSTLKPFLYGLAFERRLLTPASLIEDSPLSLNTTNGLYAPQNYTAAYRGWVSARMALGGSLNIPAVRALVLVTPDTFHTRLKALGYVSLTENGDYYGYSLALGSADVSLLMQANAFRTLANRARWSPLGVVPGKQRTPCGDPTCAAAFSGAPRAAGDAGAAFMVADILADRSARAGTFGLESWLATPYWAAVKTGTSKDMRDNWCIGFTRRHTVAVWVGNASGSAMHDVSGVSGAAPVWREIMDWLSAGDHPVPEAPPPGIVRTVVEFEPAHEPRREEWFLRGTETRRMRAALPGALGRIVSPRDGSVIALDPDIPVLRQRVRIALAGQPDPAWRLRMDGQPLGPARSVTPWLPAPGKHTLELVDRAGQVLDRVSLEVRAIRSGRANGGSR